MATIKIGSYEYTEDEVDAAQHAYVNKDSKAISDLLRKKAPRISYNDFCTESKALAVYCSTHLIKT
ncbi:MAG TPA: hypothetical protein VF803_00540 [Candidatus Paceibacterota bacterium]